MIGTKLYKGQYTNKEYADLTVWCNANGCTIEEHEEYYEVVEIPAHVPTIYETKEGKWLETHNTNQKRCSNCDKICFITIYPWFHGQAAFCPACGAKMDSVEEWEFRSE